MENHPENQPTEAENTPKEGYVPRPAWQIWAARLGLILFLIIVIGQLLSIAGGGL